MLKNISGNEHVRKFLFSKARITALLQLFNRLMLNPEKYDIPYNPIIAFANHA